MLLTMFVKMAPNCRGGNWPGQKREKMDKQQRKNHYMKNTGNKTNIKVTCYFDYYYNFKHCKSNFRLEKSVTYTDIVLYTVGIYIQHLTYQNYNLFY